jgi:hypothetical protein
MLVLIIPLISLVGCSCTFLTKVFHALVILPNFANLSLDIWECENNHCQFGF